MPADALAAARNQAWFAIEQSANAHECEWLIDNAATYDHLVRSIRNAQSSIWISQLGLDVDCIAYGTGGAPDVNLADLIVEAATDRCVDVRILMNKTLLLDTVTPLRKWLASRDAPSVQVRGMSRFPQLLHAKMVVVDEEEVFLVGSPFVNGYWDDSTHAPTDARRPMRELGGRPLHDVSVRLTGSPVCDAMQLFTDWWNAASADDCAEAKQTTVIERDNGVFARRPDKNAAVQLVSTSPSSEARRGRTDILHACLDGIGRARSLIYIEHQYLSARPVVDALESALAQNADLEIIILLNQNPDITAYRRWQNDRLKRSGLKSHPRVGIFSLWSTETKSDRIRATSQVFVHSKVLIVDDSWAMVGSANLDGVSLHSYGDDFAGPFARRLFRNVRNFDVTAVIRDGVDGVDANGAIASLRTKLWAEHLGMNAGATRERPAAGWLSLWRKRAEKNVAALDINDVHHRFRGFVLPYSERATPAAQLSSLGIRRRSDSPTLRFNPGWMEVYLSPNWVRNMFL